MAKGHLEFTLPEERVEFELAINAVKYSIALHEVEEKLRGWDKYGLPEYTRTMGHEELISWVREQLLNVICEHAPQDT